MIASPHGQCTATATEIRSTRGFLLAQVFFGLWLLPMGYLAFTSGTITLIWEPPERNPTLEIFARVTYLRMAVFKCVELLGFREPSGRRDHMFACFEETCPTRCIEQFYDQQGNISFGTIPLLMLDMWEHAFYLDYVNVKADYVKAFWNIVNWADVQARFDAARNGASIMLIRPDKVSQPSSRLRRQRTSLSSMTTLRTARGVERVGIISLRLPLGP
nr:Fe-Mn family superoxide dismutase [Arthrobacter crystallopoietes]